MPYPGALQYEAFDEVGEAIALPELGLKIATRAPEAGNREDLSWLLLATLKETTGVSDLDYDGDGDIGIRYGSHWRFEVA